MQNQIHFDLPPEELILDPFQAPGFHVLRQPEFLWRSIPAGRIHGFAASEHPAIDERITGVLAATRRDRMFPRAIEVATVPVHLTDVWFRKSWVTQGDACLISGAAGLRLLNRYAWENEDAEGDQALAEHFARAQARPGPRRLTPLAGALPPDTPIAIECRNTFNYYHFLTESLCQLCLVEETGLKGPIYLHFPNNEDKTRAFTRAFVEALFPELAPRVIFDRTPVHHDAVVVPYNFTASLYQLSEAELADFEHEFPPVGAWKGRRATRASHAILAGHAVDSSLFKLRARALKAIQGRDTAHLPRRFWVTRDTGLARDRTMKGEDEILDMLRLFGFEEVAFERLSPLDQIALMAHAEMMISYHGAGFTNMLFAPPEATVIEIGTLQTAMYRWSDFWPIAAVSGCRYLTFFADFDAEDPTREPLFSEDGIVPVHLSRLGLARIMSLVVALLDKIPQFQNPQDVQLLGQQLMAMGEYDRAGALFDAHRPLVEGHPGLALAMADLAEHRGDKAQTLAALYAAYRADPSDWAVLIRMLWCARAMNQAELVTTLLATLHDGFPDRFQAFARARPWVRDFYNPDIAQTA